MINFSSDQIKEIADQLDSGNRVYLNKETGTILFTPDFDSGYVDEELWQDDINELEENWEKYIEINKMNSNEFFEIMADFAEQVDNAELRYSLVNALNKKHPFQNFKWVVDNSGPYRLKWFEFKNMRLIGWVETKLRDIDDLTT